MFPLPILFQCLTDSCIKTSGLDNTSLTSLCPNVVDLDLAGKLCVLFYFWASLSECVTQLWQLSSSSVLNISEIHVTCSCTYVCNVFEIHLEC